MQKTKKSCIHTANPFVTSILLTGTKFILKISDIVNVVCKLLNLF